MRLSTAFFRTTLLCCALPAATACHGDRSKLPPVHIIQNMDHQQRFDAQEQNDIFADGRGMRPPVPGTVAVGALRDDDHLYAGKGLDGELVDELPPSIRLNEQFLLRGQQRYNIYCSPCHDESGGGEGVVVQRGMLRPPALNDARLVSEPLGHFYSVITNGIRNMPSYADQIPVKDRWAIVAYVRTLQRSEYATREQVPKLAAKQLGWD
ncbi:MAG: cytochrome c [Myxococcales bacterium FL481]|nr:MAG: cytochrome c [Myxococcales bacterium FL481]